MGADVDITVIVCTRNGSAHLRKRFATVVAAVRQASHACELLVVDNGSTDDSADVVRSLAPEAQVVSEPAPGLARARNAGVRAAHGRAILFTDDDVEPPTGWVDAMADPLLTGTADVVAGGIRVDDSLRQPWMSSWLLAQFADHPRPGQDDAFLVGANFGATRSVLVDLPFDEHLGAPPYQREEDAFFWVQAKERGLRIRGVDGPPAVHYFDASRLTTPALIALAETMGRCEAFVWYHWLHGHAPALRLKRLVYRTRCWWQGQRPAEHPSDQSLRMIAKASFVGELIRLDGTPRLYPSPSERAAKSASAVGD